MSKTSALPALVLIGGGGHASVIAEILLEQGREIVAVVCPDDITERRVFDGLFHIQEDEDVRNFDPQKVRLINGLGMLPNGTARQSIALRFIELGYTFDSVIASSASVSPFAQIEQGVQILPQAIVNTGAYVGAHSIINTGSLVEHDCVIGSFNHIAPKSVLCGQVKTGRNVFIGANATLIQNIEIGSNAIIGAGVTLTQSL
ncbi:NeuD/PglB/VioB family sugar acetyltransferase [Vibrio algivorus]|uniref:Shikimate dehydrogenase n=1 Tax=Vibrio algivorus TaxID=1667024 RepID=A0A557P4Y2_9VIBR|nr:NeuD/PglB/VioB family sugar acetyltransferase [Vibrio algivorus]TVO35733.1 shikimate dehydrogenase [Vibrio algivorus]